MAWRNASIGLIFCPIRSDAFARHFAIGNFSVREGPHRCTYERLLWVDFRPYDGQQSANRCHLSSSKKSVAGHGRKGELA